jgi:hypothetical protein
MGPTVDRAMMVIVDPENPTWQSHIIPGVRIFPRQFSMISAEDKVQVAIGGIWVSDEDRYVRFLAFESLSSAGPATDSREFTILNNSGVTLTDIEVRVVNRISVFQESDDDDRRAIPFKSIVQASSLNPRFDGYSSYPLDITFEDYGSNINLLIDGMGYDVYDDAGTLYPSGQNLPYDGSTRYWIADNSPFPGLSFILSSNLTSSDEAELYVANGSDVFEIKSATDDPWTGEGEKIIVSESLDDGESTTFLLRANPHLDILNSPVYPVEGLIQIIGKESSGTEHITSVPVASVVRDRIPPLTMRASIIDSTTMDVLETFGITEVVLGEAS